MSDHTYNGWANRQTWNVALWIGNDEGLYRAACDFMGRYHGRAPYRNFIISMGLEDSRTPDGIGWYTDRLAYAALNEMMREFAS